MGVPGDAWDAQIAHGRNEGGGASIKMWHDYFPRATIYGIDINPAPHLVDNDRITTYVFDEGDTAQLQEFVEETGCSSTSSSTTAATGQYHQQITLAALWPHLKPGGPLLHRGPDQQRTGTRTPAASPPEPCSTLGACFASTSMTSIR